jgi:hypothetical protein
MKEKGKNLATKEDIKEITQKTEEVKVVFQKEFLNFSTEHKFKNDFSYKQYSQLYAKLYAIVVQSEYLRYFGEKYQNAKLPYDEFPFLETSRTIIKTQRNLFTGEILKHQEEKVNDSITDFNKKEICDFIIANGDLASQNLLKLSIAYRYANSHYTGSGKPPDDEKIKKAFDDEEFELIKKMVRTIISDYNSLRKIINLDFNKSELKSGLFDEEDYRFS